MWLHGRNSVSYCALTVFRSIGYTSTSVSLLASGIYGVLKFIAPPSSPSFPSSRWIVNYRPSSRLLELPRCRTSMTPSSLWDGGKCSWCTVRVFSPPGQDIMVLLSRRRPSVYGVWILISKLPGTGTSSRGPEPSGEEMILTFPLANGRCDTCLSKPRMCKFRRDNHSSPPSGRRRMRYAKSEGVRPATGWGRCGTMSAYEEVA